MTTRRRAHPGWSEDHEILRASIRAFVERELGPHVDAWEEAGEFPRALYRKAGDHGLLGLGFPEDFGGTPADSFTKLIIAEELCRPGAGGLVAGLMSHGIGLPPLLALGSPQLQAKVAPGVLRGEQVCALAITEPSGGSDVANLQTRARREGDHYIVDGSKTFITSGMRADWITTAVRTGEPGMQGISLLAIPGDAPGLSRTKLDKMGWWCSDTATLYFDACKVPAENLIGPENAGFMGIMVNFNGERMMLAAMALSLSRVCFEEALAWAQQRQTFGKPLVRHQVVRHKLVDMATAIRAVECVLDDLAWRIDKGEQPIAEVCMAKNLATQCVELCAKEGVQILGGAGFTRGTKCERIYRETKVLSIGGGAEEIMKELAARQLGLL
ncbi:acyl-CoA dehydrogenase family protein [Pseudenhygromyxa sp. WMMC2535]|uniref:acyl-CoA dehydrogenase family protein n=1 Tax=Pseudenhygromyxa sp. WMMC2535 TaxID=2712867 RepID=UPI00155595B3|nr:acyl-CoA dehydrogenase family protein [Pseudenhygromyxa sp. WMMC2535]NVB40986.1 acyl-CoA dehydrogenase family protein [Pseudenhygromyxa sp. WMMC2535]